MDYGKAVRICRAAFDLTQEELAARVRIGASQISLIESGKRQPSTRTIADLSRALGIPRSLLELLAAGPEELAEEDEEIVDRLARKLVHLLAKADLQQELDLGGE